MVGFSNLALRNRKLRTELEKSLNYDGFYLTLVAHVEAVVQLCVTCLHLEMYIYYYIQ